MLYKIGLQAKIKGVIKVAKQNCWEFKKCGREPGGWKALTGGTVCPAASDDIYDGAYGGEKCGRVCWAVAGTSCGGKVQGTEAQKRKTCMDCDFFKAVKEEEGKNFTPFVATRFRKYEKKLAALRGGKGQEAPKETKGGVTR